MEDLVTADGPWQVKATLTGATDQKGTLLGSLTVDVVKGIATFDTLAISHSGTYDIVFQVVRPDSVDVTVTVSHVGVVNRDMTAEVTPLTATVDIPFNLSVTVKDVIGGKTVTNLDWQVSSKVCVIAYNINYRYISQCRRIFVSYYLCLGLILRRFMLKRPQLFVNRVTRGPALCSWTLSLKHLARLPLKRRLYV